MHILAHEKKCVRFVDEWIYMEYMPSQSVRSSGMNQSRVLRKKLDMDDFSILSSQTKYEIEYVGLSIYINSAQKVIVELQDKLKFSQKRFAREFKRAEELTTTLATRDQSHGAKLALKAKELQDSKAARSTE